MASEVIDRARACYRERAWAAAYADFHAADDESPLAIDDLEQLAVTAYLIGKDDDSLELWARAHRDCLRLDDAERAARCGFWLAFHCFSAATSSGAEVGSPGSSGCSTTVGSTAQYRGMSWS